MRKILLLILSFMMCISFNSCSIPDNYPGQVKVQYWVSEDERMFFRFPAEAGIGNATGHMIIDEAICETVILEWNGKDGVVEVTDAGGNFLFRADTKTDGDNLICTFDITSQSSKLDLPDSITFNLGQKLPKHLLSNNYFPEQTSLEFWILQDVSMTDWSSYIENTGWMGAREFFGKGYTPIQSEDGTITEPENCVKYLISAWPDYADGGNYVTRITVTDPSVIMWGLTIESSVEEFNNVLCAMGFEYNEGEKSDPGIEYKCLWKCKNYTVTLCKRNGKCMVYFDAPVTNVDNIIF